MVYPDGIATELFIEDEAGETQRFEVALGPSAALGDLHGALERFAEAFTLSVGAHAFELGTMRMCLFDPARLLVSFDEDDDGAPSAEDAMDKRFAFAFIAMLEEQYSEHDPWLVVRPCSRDHVRHWRSLLALDDRFQVRTWCLDERLAARFSES